MGHRSPHNRGRNILNPRVDPYYCEWGEVVGARIRRLRQAKGMRLLDVARAVRAPEGGHHSVGYISRLERGSSSAPFFTYVAIVDVLGADPGRVFGPERFGPGADEPEKMLLHCLRGLRIKPEDAMLRLLADPLDADQQIESLDAGLISGGPVVGD